MLHRLDGNVVVRDFDAEESETAFQFISLRQQVFLRALQDFPPHPQSFFASFFRQRKVAFHIRQRQTCRAEAADGIEPCLLALAVAAVA